MVTNLVAKEELLKVEDLSIKFKSGKKQFVNAVSHVDFTIHKGETLALVGESGCGKSVTSLSIMRLITNSVGKIEGKIILKEKDLNLVSEKKMRSIRGKDVSMIFQEPMTSLNPVHKIGKQISEVLKLHTDISGDELKKQTVEMLEKVGIARPEKIVKEYPHQLSGGIRQRVMIAMAMACNPSLLIADEPTTALDVTIQAQILDLMNDLKKNYDTAILLITHDLGVVAEMADRVMVMYYGQIVEETDIKTIFKNPQHPYTIGLLNSIPRLEGEMDSLQPIEGNVPNIGEVTKGCPFFSRCTHADSRCLEENPPLVKTDKGHSVRCWLYINEEVLT
ncbi:peptide ABC transporter ATP-binding protein [Bacillus canaveralius]|uniref:Peptide ABC transporter ATP-binding protein n=1 Tax=Bacillus canaveralius TaxID=1403243 RepID=A0A2N5GGG3_9BACI|nr:ABC transporter ATP-binding protein [Bacillus canaveralius]PLR79835.1 peptide ABC transporter ATP-binding protein [Bacillus canaveralius]PLR97816.1 peptide ABC transporter ATP-binding protein [Bacillus canaveralius]